MSEQVAELTTEQLQKELEKRKKKEQQEAEKRKKHYENTREDLVKDLIQGAQNVNHVLTDFKKHAYDQLHSFYHFMHEYGEINPNNKGTFTLKSDDGKYAIQFEHHVNKGFDERAEMAEEKLKTFLESKVKKRDKQTYRMVISLLERNHVTGDFDIKLINRLVKMENEIDDPDWKESIKLFKESYQETESTFYIRFKQRNDKTGMWDSIELNFSSVKI